MNSLFNPTKAGDKVKPTVALDFTFGRKHVVGGEGKVLAQVWELGGGGDRESRLAELLPVVVTKQRLEEGMCVVVVFDLADAGAAFELCRFWLSLLDKYDPAPSKVLVGNMYDKVRDEDPMKKKLLAQAFRHLALSYNADLVFTGSNEKQAASAAKALLNHYAFDGEKKKAAQLNPNKPIYVPLGQDTFEAIGKFPAAEQSEKEQMEFWGRTLLEHFPRRTPDGRVREGKDNDEEDMERKEENSSEKKRDGFIQVGPIRLATEKVIDKCFEEKTKQLEQYKKASRKGRLTQ